FVFQLRATYEFEIYLLVFSDHFIGHDAVWVRTSEVSDLVRDEYLQRQWFWINILWYSYGFSFLSHILYSNTIGNSYSLRSPSDSWIVVWLMPFSTTFNCPFPKRLK